MPIYRYIITTPSGSTVEKTLTSSSKASLKEHLEREGNFVLDIRREEGFGSLLKKGGRQSRIKLKDFLVFNQ